MMSKGLVLGQIWHLKTAEELEPGICLFEEKCFCSEDSDIQISSRN